MPDIDCISTLCDGCLLRNSPLAAPRGPGASAHKLLRDAAHLQQQCKYSISEPSVLLTASGLHLHLVAPGSRVRQHVCVVQRRCTQNKGTLINEVHLQLRVAAWLYRPPQPRRLRQHRIFISTAFRQELKDQVPLDSHLQRRAAACPHWPGSATAVASPAAPPHSHLDSIQARAERPGFDGFSPVAVSGSMSALAKFSDRSRVIRGTTATRVPWWASLQRRSVSDVSPPSRVQSSSCMSGNILREQEHERLVESSGLHAQTMLSVASR